MDPLLLAGAAAALVFLIRGKKKPPRPTVVAPDLPTDEPKRQLGRPTGHPPPYGASCLSPTNAYDAEFWDSKAKILEAFDFLGYETPDDRDTMNQLGPDGALGGGDDVPNSEVRRFQKNYNRVSRGKKFLPNMRGLDEDGKVGPCTLTGMKLVLDNLQDNKWGQIVTKS